MQENVFYEAQKDNNTSLYRITDGGGTNVLHFHRAMEISYVLSGSVTFYLEDKVFTASKDDIIFVDSYLKHKAIPIENYNAHILGFPTVISDEISAIFKGKTLPYLLGDKEFNAKFLPIIETLVKDGDKKNDVIIRGYTSALFGEFALHYKTEKIKPKSKSVSLVQDILEYIDAHFSEPLTLEDLSEHFGYTTCYFSRTFNNLIGIPLKTYLNFIRYSKYKKEVKNNPQKSKTQIIFDCGFASLPTFYRVEKSLTKSE
jgi:AraC-like DNA-binding protein